MKGYPTIITLVVIIVTANIDILCPRDRGRDFGDVLEEQMNLCSVVYYTDSNFGFKVPYPALFILDKSIPDSVIGCSRFSYDNVINMAIDCYVCRNEGYSDADGGISWLAEKMRAEVIEDKGDVFLHGPLTEDGGRVDGYSHFTKCVAKDKLWVIYSLTYPDMYADRLLRLFSMVRTWQPWEKGTTP